MASYCPFFLFYFQELNHYLEDKVYIAGNVFTLADILMYYGIHHIVVSLSVGSKLQSFQRNETDLKLKPSDASSA